MIRTGRRPPARGLDTAAAKNSTSASVCAASSRGPPERPMHASNSRCGSQGAGAVRGGIPSLRARAGCSVMPTRRAGVLFSSACRHRHVLDRHRGQSRRPAAGRPRWDCRRWRASAPPSPGPVQRPKSGNRCWSTRAGPRELARVSVAEPGSGAGTEVGDQLLAGQVRTAGVGARSVAEPGSGTGDEVGDRQLVDQVGTAGVGARPRRRARVRHQHRSGRPAAGRPGRDRRCRRASASPSPRPAPAPKRGTSCWPTRSGPQALARVSVAEPEPGAGAEVADRLLADQVRTAGVGARQRRRARVRHRGRSRRPTASRPGRDRRRWRASAPPSPSPAPAPKSRTGCWPTRSGPQALARVSVAEPGSDVGAEAGDQLQVGQLGTAGVGERQRRRARVRRRSRDLLLVGHARIAGVGARQRRRARVRHRRRSRRPAAGRPGRDRRRWRASAPPSPGPAPGLKSATRCWPVRSGPQALARVSTAEPGSGTGAEVGDPLLADQVGTAGVGTRQRRRARSPGRSR